MSNKKVLKFDEYDQAVVYAILNDIKNYHVGGDKRLGWILLKGNKPIKGNINV
jgi:hypothetical protein